MTQPKLFARIAATAITLVFAATAGTACARDYWFGADLSYVNEMRDCGAVYREGGKVDDAFAIFARTGTNLVRVRLWVDARWTRYSNLADAEKTIAEAKAQGMKVLLDLHYSDDWADGDKQIVPAAWAGLDEDAQVKALYQYTRDTLDALKAKGLMPDMVQVGNETNHEMALPPPGVASGPINWNRNARLFNAGIKAVRDASRDSATRPRIMIHIAQPENVEAWFAAAAKAGVSDFDIIGMSYYSKWSKEGLADLGETIRRVHALWNKDVVVVETAYAFAPDNADTSPNLLGADSAIPGYPVTPDGQAKYMHDLMQLTLDSGGIGVVYWEPAWVSTKCKTRWGQGSNWDNSTLFDVKGDALPALYWPKAGYVMPVEVTFEVEAGKVKADERAAVWLGGDFTGGVAVPMRRDGDTFIYKSWLRPGSHIIAGTAATPDALNSAEAQDIALPAAERAQVIVLAAPQPAPVAKP